MSAAEARQVLRALLRAVDRSITSATGNRQWRDFVIAEFRRGAQLTDPAERKLALRAAEDYAFLITSVREHKVRLVKPQAHQVGLACPLPPQQRQRHVWAPPVLHVLTLPSRRLPTSPCRSFCSLTTSASPSTSVRGI